MIKPKTISQCISSDYCRGWNDAVAEANATEKKMCVKAFEDGYKGAESQVMERKELVKCKDCQHAVGTFRIDDGKLGHVCSKIHGGAMYRAVEPDFFCAYGKPRCDNDDCIPDHVPGEDSWG